MVTFDPLKPTSLLYKKTSDGGYQLLGAMYTDRVSATEQELDERIPLSVARWHFGRRVSSSSIWMDGSCVPYGTDAEKLRSTNDDDEGRDNMDHSIVPGMKVK